MQADRGSHEDANALRWQGGDILDSLAAHVTLIDGQGNILAVNRACREFAAANPEAAADQIGVGANYLALMGKGAEAQRLVEGIQSVLGGTASEFIHDYPLHSPTHRRWFQLSATPVKLGNQFGAVISQLDVTARKRIELLLADEKRALEMIAAGAELGETLTAIALGIENQLVGVVCSILLLDADGVHLRHGAGPNLPDEYNQLVDGIAIGPHVGSCGTAAFRNETVIVEDIATDPLWADHKLIAERFGLRACWSKPIAAPSGKVAGTFAMYHGKPRRPSDWEIELIERAADLASIAIERAASTATLRQSNRRLRALIDVSPLAIVVLDPQGNVLIWSDASERLLGWTQAEVLGRPAPYVPPDQMDDFRENLASGMAGAGWAGKEIVRRKKDGSTVQLSLWSMPMRNEDGQVVALVGMLADNTERKLLEEQFRQAQKMEAVGRLAGGIAHDFNNLLTVIAGYVDILLNATRAGDPREALLREILEASKRGAALTRQLLAFSRKQVLELRSVDLAALIARSRKMLERLLGEDVVLVVSGPPDLRLVRTDPSQMEHVLMNLVVNAKDAMPHGGLLTIDIANVTTSSSHRDASNDLPAGDCVRLTVSDTGVGMDEQTRVRAFEPFYTTKQEGTGLGLAMAHGFVKQCGGHIEIRSQVGIGSTVEIHMPAVEGIAGAPLPTARSERLPGGSETILLVEDEPVVRNLTRVVMQKCGYQVLESTSSAHAVEIADSHPGPIDLLVTDLVMPEMGGRAVAKLVAQRRPQCGVLYFSGYPAEDEILPDPSGTSEAFLAKPFTPQALAKKIRDVLDRGDRPRSFSASLPTHR